LRQGVVTHQELAQRSLADSSNTSASKPPSAAFGGQGFADQLLQGGVAGPDDFVLAEPDDQFGGHESWHHVAPHDLFGLLCQLRQEARRPRPVAEQFGDLTRWL
jgi:hypothetical protein